MLSALEIVREEGPEEKGDIVEPLWRESKSKFTFPLAKPLFNKSHELSGLRTDFKRLFPCIQTLVKPQVSMAGLQEASAWVGEANEESVSEAAI